MDNNQENKSDISKRMKEITNEINQLKESKIDGYEIKIDLLNNEYTKLYGKLLAE